MEAQAKEKFDRMSGRAPIPRSHQKLPRLPRALSPFSPFSRVTTPRNQHSCSHDLSLSLPSSRSVLCARFHQYEEYVEFIAQHLRKAKQARTQSRVHKNEVSERKVTPLLLFVTERGMRY